MFLSVHLKKRSGVTTTTKLASRLLWYARSLSCVVRLTKQLVFYLHYTLHAYCKQEPKHIFSLRVYFLLFLFLGVFFYAFNYSDCVLESEHCQNAGDLHSALCLNTSWLDTDRGLKLLLLLSLCRHVVGAQRQILVIRHNRSAGIKNVRSVVPNLGVGAPPGGLKINLRGYEMTNGIGKGEQRRCTNCILVVAQNMTEQMLNL